MNQVVSHKPDPTEGDREAPVRRKYKNFLLQPGLQTTLGLYSIILSFLFAGTVIAIIYFNFAELIDSILLLTDAPEEVKDIMSSYWRASQVYIYLAVGVYISAMITITIWYTHRLVGPSIAFRRHILALISEKYYARTNLRKGDAFAEVAEALNSLSEALEEKERLK